MSNSICCLLMRRVSQTPYPLIAPQLPSRQFGGRQGSSSAHTTQTFLNNPDPLTNTEAILAFDVYHAFDSPPEIPHPANPAANGHTREATTPHFPVLEHGVTFM